FLLHTVDRCPYNAARASENRPMVGSKRLANQHPVEIHCRPCNTRFDVPIEQIRSQREMSCPACAALIVLGTSDITAQIRQIENAMVDMQELLAKGSAFEDRGRWGGREAVAEKLPADMPAREDRG